MVWTSLFGIVTLIFLARALGFAKAPILADADAARQIAADALPGFGDAEVALGKDSRGALVAARDGRVALVRPMGDRWVVRLVNGAEAQMQGGKLRIVTPEWMFPPAEIDLGAAAAAWARRL